MVKLRVTKWAILILGICLSNLSSLISQDTAIEELAFQNHERVVYKIYYNWKFIWVPAGEVVFNVREKNDHFELNVMGYSFESYDSFFKVRDYYTSRVSKESLLPHNFRRNILEGNYTCYDSLSFDQNDFTIFEKFGKDEARAKSYNFQLENTVLDMVSAIYYLRSFPINNIDPNDEIPFHIFFDKEYFDLNIRYIGEKEKKIKSLGKIKTLHFQPQLVDGYVFQEGDIMNVYISNDKNKLPVLIESPINIGSVKAILQSASGLKYPSVIDLFQE